MRVGLGVERFVSFSSRLMERRQKCTCIRMQMRIRTHTRTRLMEGWLRRVEVLQWRLRQWVERMEWVHTLAVR